VRWEGGKVEGEGRGRRKEEQGTAREKGEGGRRGVVTQS
jgi:hypothetical protein